MPSSISADEENELAKKTKTGLRDAIVFCLYFDTLAGWQVSVLCPSFIMESILVFFLTYSSI